MKKILSFLFVFVLMIGSAFAASTTIVSDTSTTWYNGASDVPAVNAWVHPSWPSISGANWIWAYYKTDTAAKWGPFVFKRNFNLPADATNIHGTLKITADNAYKLYVNNGFVGQDGFVTNPVTSHFVDTLHVQRWNSTETYIVDLNLVPGANQIMVNASSYGDWIDYKKNPAGLIYRLDITYDQSHDVPEFGTIAAGLALAGAGAYISFRRKK